MLFRSNLLGTNSNYHADENYMDPYMTGSAQNNMALQKQLMDQANGGGPNLADQMNQMAVARNQAASASLLGGMKGISPAASMRAIANAQGQAGADAAGQAVLARMQQQMEAQRLLGVNSMGMTGIGAGAKSAARIEGSVLLALADRAKPRAPTPCGKVPDMGFAPCDLPAGHDGNEHERCTLDANP